MKPFRPGTKPYPHQAKAFKKSRDKEAWGHLWDVDCGKTWISIQEIAYQFHRGKCDGALVIAPKGMYHQWPEEWTTHAPQAIRDQTYVYLWNNTVTQKNRVAYGRLYPKEPQALPPIGSKTEAVRFYPFEGFNYRDPAFTIFVLNSEALSSPKGRKAAEQFIKAKNCFMVVDESSMFRNHKAKRTKALIALGRLAMFRRILTGTAVANSPLDIFTQMQFLDSKILGGNFFAFRARYAILKRMQIGFRGFDIVVGYRNIKDLEERIAPYTGQMDREACYGMPPKSYRTWEVDLTIEQKHMYAELIRTFVLELGESIITAPMRLTQDMKLRQLTCGFLYDDDHNVYKFKGAQRIQALMDLLSTIKGKVIIWADFVEAANQIAKAIYTEYQDTSYVVYMGGLSTKERAARQLRFNEDPKCRFFIANPQTGKFGLNLKPALNMVYYTTSFDYEARIQTEGRMRERKKVLTVWDLVARGTIEEKIRKVLINKKKLSNSVLGKEWTAWLTFL